MSLALKRIVAVVLGLLLVAGCDEKQDATVPVEIGGRTFELEVAADTAARAQGLMRREAIPEDGGMIFIFPRAEVQSFWMGHCLVDIDILFLDGQGRVTAMHHMVAEPPQREDESDAAYRARMPSYSSVYPALFAIELEGGTLEGLDVEFQDKIALDRGRLKRLAR